MPDMQSISVIMGGTGGRKSFTPLDITVHTRIVKIIRTLRNLYSFKIELKN